MGCQSWAKVPVAKYVCFVLKAAIDLTGLYFVGSLRDLRTDEGKVALKYFACAGSSPKRMRRTQGHGATLELAIFSCMASVAKAVCLKKVT